MILVGACPAFSTLDYKKWPGEPYIVIFAEGEVSLIQVQSSGCSIEAVQSFNALTT
jgi:hypothetical protein